VDNVFEMLKERGFVQQVTDEAAVTRLLSETATRYYAGFDPTADSLHVGHLLPIMAMAHLQRAGHVPIAIVGGGTAMVGDPSGKTEMRQILAKEDIEANALGVSAQLKRYLNFDDGKGFFFNNADWLLGLSYIEFLRDIGRHFRVNEMVKVESYRARLERDEGLSFIEFNYQLLQAYDFLYLSQNYGCLLEMGGSDQWGNIVAGVDLVRRVEGKSAYGLTFPLLTTARGEKMGKTAQGAVWLSAERTSPYEFYQYWINSDDRDVERFLAYFTFLPMDEVRGLGALQDAALREAKETLAYEATRLAHGVEAADNARTASQAAFGGAGDMSAVPSTTIESARLAAGIPVLDLLVATGLAESKGAGRRLIAQGGAYINGVAVADSEFVVNESSLDEAAILLRTGKKKYHRVLFG